MTKHSGAAISREEKRGEMSPEEIARSLESLIKLLRRLARKRPAAVLVLETLVGNMLAKLG